MPEAGGLHGGEEAVIGRHADARCKIIWRADLVAEKK